MGARYVVRATADNPAIDIDGPERVLQQLRASGADYVVEAGLPYGACVEAVTLLIKLRCDGLRGSYGSLEILTTDGKALSRMPSR